jgi:hypothetical protein
MTDAAWAEVVSAIALALITALLVLVRRTVVITNRPLTYTRPRTPGTDTAPKDSPGPNDAASESSAGTSDTATHSVNGDVTVSLDKGAVIPSEDLGFVPEGSYRRITISLMRLLVIGADNRTSTSKVIAFSWTYAIVFGLFAVLVAKWLGDATGYQSLVANGIREEYWLFLGGPYAAAIAAKYAATTQNQGSGRPRAPVDGATVGQLVTNDEGNGDLGDFQYVVFNALALAFYLGSFIPHLNDGLPHLPPVLTGLALTSAGAYTAKKFLRQAPPTLTSLLPTSAPPSTATEPSTVEVWGSNLIVPASVAPTGSPLPPTVLIAGVAATVTASQETMGADHLTVQVPETVQANTQVKLSAVRADGIPAIGPGGSDGLALNITSST